MQAIWDNLKSLSSDNGAWKGMKTTHEKKSQCCVFLLLVDGNQSEIIASALICMTLHAALPSFIVIFNWTVCPPVAQKDKKKLSLSDMIQARGLQPCSALCGETHPRHDEFSAQILNFSFHLAANVELMTVQGNSLQVGQQILLACWIRALNWKKKDKETHC